MTNKLKKFNQERFAKTELLGRSKSGRCRQIKLLLSASTWMRAESKLKVKVLYMCMR